MESEAALSADALDRLAVGVVFVDRLSRVRHANRRGADLLKKGDGLSSKRDGLAALSSDGTRILRKAIWEASLTSARQTGSAGGALRLPRRSGKRAYEVLVAPLPARSFGRWSGGATAAVLIRDPESDTAAPPEVLAALYGLTPAESRLAAAFSAGQSVKDYAEAAKITIGTARWTLKQVMAKTDTRRQSELVRLLLAGVARFGRRDEESE